MKFLDDSALNYLVGKITNLKTAYNYNERSQYGDSFLNYTLEDLKRINTLGTWNGNVYTSNGITATVNNNMSITFDGTPTSQYYFEVVAEGTALPPVGYYLFGCPSGGGTDKYCLILTCEDSEESLNDYLDYGQGVQITHIDSRVDRIYLSIDIHITVSNLTFNPRICSNSQGITHSVVLDDLYNSSYASNSKKLHTITGGLTVGKLNDNYPLFDVRGGSSNNTIKFFRGTQYNSTKTSQNSPAIVIDDNKIRFRNELLLERNTYVPLEAGSSILKSLFVKFKLSDKGIYLGHEKEDKGDSYLKMSHSHTYLIGAEMLTLATGGGTIRIGKEDVYQPKPQKIELNTTDSQVEIKPTSMYLRTPKKVQFYSDSAQSTVSGYIDNFRVYAEDVDFYIPIKSDDDSGKFNVSVGEAYRLRIGEEDTYISNEHIYIQPTHACYIKTQGFEVYSNNVRAAKIENNRQEYMLYRLRDDNNYSYGYQYIIHDSSENRLIYIQAKKHNINSQTYYLGKFSLACPTIDYNTSTGSITEGRRRFLWYMSGYNGTQTTTNFDGLKIGYNLDTNPNDCIYCHESLIEMSGTDIVLNATSIDFHGEEEIRLITLPNFKAYYTHSTSIPTANDEIATIGDVNATTQSSQTVEGNLVHIEDAAPINAEECKVALTPNQNLHGYDKPWTGGGNINLMLPGEAKTYTENGITFTSDGNGIYTIKGTATADAVCYFECGEYIVPDGTNHSIGFMNTQSKSTNVSFDFYNNSTMVDSWVLNPINRVQYSYSTLSNQTVNKYRIRVSSNTEVNMTISPMVIAGITSGSFPSTFSPYSNICPINGYTGVELTQTGKNLYPIKIGSDSFDNNAGGTHQNDNGTLVVNTINSQHSGVYSSYNNSCSIYVIPSILNGVYTYSCNIKAANATTVLFGYTDFGRKNVNVTTEWQRISITTTFNRTKNPFCIYCNTENTIEIKDFQIEVGSTATAYEPYQANTFPVTFHALGKNLCPISENEFISSYTWTSLDGQNANTYTNGTEVFLRAGTYTFWSSEKTNIETAQVIGLKSGTLVNSPAATTFTCNTDDTLYIRIKGASSGTAVSFKLQLEAGSTATTYEPYTNTVYGGEVDYVRGKLRVTYVLVDLGSLSWSRVTTPYGYRYYSDLTPASLQCDTSGNSLAFCSVYKLIGTGETSTVKTGFTVSADGKVFIHDNVIQDESTEAFGQRMNGQTLCYPLATPIEYDLTPQQIVLFENYNNLWADNGIVNLTYQPNNMVGELKGQIQNLQEQINILINQLNNLSN